MIKAIFFETFEVLEIEIPTNTHFVTDELAVRVYILSEREFRLQLLIFSPAKTTDYQASKLFVHTTFSHLKDDVLLHPKILTIPSCLKAQVK